MRDIFRTIRARDRELHRRNAVLLLVLGFCSFACCLTHDIDFFLAFAGMSAGFKERSQRVLTMLRQANTSFLLICAPEPASLLALRALKLPPTGGGDTCWGSMYAAYETLSDPVRTMIDGLQAEHSAYKTLPLLGGGNTGYLQNELRSVHPVVRVHPETGRKALFVNELWTEKIVGVSQHESDSLLAMLWKHAQSPEFTMRWTWQVGDLALWDNRSFQHYAVRDYQGERVLQKGYVQGDRPYGPR